MFLDYKQHSGQGFWINLLVDVSSILGISYDSLRDKDINEFFYLMKKAEQKILHSKTQNNAG
jgi:hypothetical protein